MWHGRVRSTLDILAALAMIIASAVVVWTHVGRPGLGGAASGGAGHLVPSMPLSLDGAWTRGDVGAKLGILVYSDFECPYCRAFARETLPKVLHDYVDTGRARLAFRHLPLASIHPHAIRMAEAAFCAGSQGRFWEMHDELFSSGSRVDSEIYSSAAERIGLNTQSFERCLSGTAARDGIDKDVAEATVLQVRTTPTLLVGTVTTDGRLAVSEVLTGNKPYSTLSEVLDRIRIRGR